MTEIDLTSILKFVSLTLTEGQDDNALTPPQVAVVRGAWEDLTTTELASLYPFTDSYLRFVSSTFWLKFSKKAGGDKISKKNFHKYIESQLADSTSILHEIDRKIKATSKLFGRPFDTGNFRGRKTELDALQKLTQSSKSVLITGMQGIGKTALAAEAFHKASASQDYEQCLWHYVGTKSYLDELKELTRPFRLADSDDIVDSFLRICRENKCFIVFDGIDPWINELGATDSFLRKLIETKHQSTFIFTSRYPIASISRLEKFGRPISTFVLNGLSYQDCLQVLYDYQVSGNNIERFLEAFQGNPLLVHKACQRIQNIFGGNFDEFIKYLTSFASDEITQNIDQIFLDKSLELSKVEYFLLAYLASQSEETIQSSSLLVSSIKKISQYTLSQIIRAFEVLQDMSLIYLKKEKDSVQVLMPKTVRRYVLKNVDNLFPLDLIECKQT